MFEKYWGIIGTIITIGTIGATIFWTQGETSHRIESLEKDTEEHSIKMNKNEEDIQEVEKSVIQIETKLDEWGKRLETLIMEM